MEDSTLRTNLIWTKKKALKHSFGQLIIPTLQIYPPPCHSVNQILISQYATVMNDQTLYDPNHRTKYPLALAYAFLQRLYEDKKYKLALRCINTHFEKRNTNHFHILSYNKAKIYQQIGKYGNALFTLEEILKEKTAFIPAVYDYCSILAFYAGRSEQAMMYLRRHIKSNDDGIVSLFLKVAAIRRLTQKEIMKIFHNTHIRLIPYYNLGMYMKKIKDYHKAQQIFSNIIEAYQKLEDDHKNKKELKKDHIVWKAKLNLAKTYEALIGVYESPKIQKTYLRKAHQIYLQFSQRFPEVAQQNTNFTQKLKYLATQDKIQAQDFFHQGKVVLPRPSKGHKENKSQKKCRTEESQGKLHFSRHQIPQQGTKKLKYLLWKQKQLKTFFDGLVVTQNTENQIVIKQSEITLIANAKQDLNKHDFQKFEQQFSQKVEYQLLQRSNEQIDEILASIMTGMNSEKSQKGLQAKELTSMNNFSQKNKFKITLTKKVDLEFRNTKTSAQGTRKNMQKMSDRNLSHIPSGSAQSLRCLTSMYNDQDSIIGNQQKTNTSFNQQQLNSTTFNQQLTNKPNFNEQKTTINPSNTALNQQISKSSKTFNQQNSAAFNLNQLSIMIANRQKQKQKEKEETIMEKKERMEFEKDLNHAQGFEDKKEYELAFDQYMKMYKKYKSSDKIKARIYVKIGNNFQLRYKPHEAEKAYLKGCKLNDPQAFLLLGMCQLKNGKVKSGVQNIEKANCIKRFDSQIENHLVYAYSLMPQTHKKALQQAINILKRDPLSLESLVMTANILQKQGKINQALEIAKAIDGYQPSESIKHYIGLLNLHDSNVPQAFSYFKNALKIKPNHIPSLIQIATILSDIKPQQSIKILQKVLTIEPKNQLALTRLGKIYESVDTNYDMAMEIYKKALQKQQTYQSYVKVGDCYEKQECYNEALSSYKSALGLKVTSEIYQKIGCIYQMKNERRKALESYETALQLLSKDSSNYQIQRNICYAVAHINLQLQQYDMAIKYTKQLIQNRQPDSPQALTLMGQAYYGKGSYQQAIQLFQRANSLTPGDDLTILQHLALCFNRKQQYNASKQLYKRILQSTPQNQNPPNIRCMNNYANILLILGNTNEAFYWFQMMIQKVPENIEKRLRVANMYATVGDWSKVEHHLMVCYKQKDNDIRVLERLVSMYKGKRENKMANKFEKKLALLRGGDKRGEGR